MKQGKGSAILLRLPRELNEHIERKVERANKLRAKRLQKPVNRQDMIKEIIRQDATRQQAE